MGGLEVLRVSESERRSGGHLGAGDSWRRGSGLEVPVDCTCVGAPVGGVLSIFAEEKTGETSDILCKSSESIGWGGRYSEVGVLENAVESIG